MSEVDYLFYQVLIRIADALELSNQIGQHRNDQLDQSNEFSLRQNQLYETNTDLQKKLVKSVIGDI